MTKIKLHTGIILIMLFIVLGATIALFCFLGPQEKTMLYYTNMSLVLLAETLFLLPTSVFVCKAKAFHVGNLSVGYMINYYALSLLILAAIYNFYLKSLGLGVNWYIGFWIILTILFSIIICVTIIGAAKQAEINDKIEEKTVLKENFRPLAMALPKKLAVVLSQMEVDPKSKEQARILLQKFSDLITRFPLLKIDRNPDCYPTIVEQITLIASQIDRVDSEESLRQLTEQIKYSHAEIEIFKN